MNIILLNNWMKMIVETKEFEV